jgi:hypothetical protein
MNDLLAYNITVSYQSLDTFYGMPLLTVESLNLDPNLLLSGSTLSTRGISQDTFRLLRYVDFASSTSSQASAVVDFSREFLQALGYIKRDTVLRSRYDIPLLICDSVRSVKIDVSLIRPSSTTVLLVVQQDETTADKWPEAQVIADAIVAFQRNSRTRARLGQPELDSMTIPCIGVVGTRAIFYLVPVTRKLNEAVATGQYPLTPTVVESCAVATESRSISEGMESLAFQQVALRHYAAFRILAEVHGSAFDIGNYICTVFPC